MTYDFRDSSGEVCCPSCRDDSRLYYGEVPEHRRVWGTAEEHTTEYWGEVRDYACENCGREWTMPKQEPQP